MTDCIRSNYRAAVDLLHALTVEGNLMFDEDEVDVFALRRGAYDAVAHGDAEIAGERNGEPVFKLTDTGRERAEEIIDTAIAQHGEAGAGIALAEALGIPEEMGDQIVAYRLSSIRNED